MPHYTAEHQQPVKNCSQAMELDLLERRIRRLVAKLAKQNIHLEVFDHNDIEYGAVLGKGGEGIVQKCRVLYNDIPVEAAVKTVLNNSDDSLTITLDEIELLCLAKDPIVNTTLQVYGVAAVPEAHDSNLGHLVIITEAGIKNALQLYQDDGSSIPLHVTYDLWSRVAASVHCIHCKRIIHQDLKPENILVTGIVRNIHGHIEKIDFKVIDLGMGRRLIADKVVSNDILGTNGYHAPEVLFDDSYDIRADIFMLGVTFCVMLLPAASLRKTALEALLQRIHDAKKQKIFGSILFTSVIEPALMNNHNYRISPSIRSMICCNTQYYTALWHQLAISRHCFIVRCVSSKMLEHVDRRNVTLLDVLERCNSEAETLRVSGAHRTSSGACPMDSGIDSLGETMASQRTLHKIGLLEGHVLRQTSPRRLRSNKKRTPVRRCSDSTSSDGSNENTPRKSTPPTARKRPSTVRRRKPTRRFSVSTTSSDVSRALTPKKQTAVARRRQSVAVVNKPFLRETRKSIAAAIKRVCEVDSDDDEETKPTSVKRRVLRSASHCA